MPIACATVYIGRAGRFSGSARPLLALLLLCSLLVPAHAGEANPLTEFQAKEAQLFEAGYKLATGNAPYCKVKAAQFGLLIHDVESYGQPDKVRSLLGLSGDIGVQAVASGSPAANAGLRQNDTILSIYGEAVDKGSNGNSADWLRARQLNELLAQSPLDGSSVRISWRDTNGVEASAEIAPVPACASSFELLTGKKGASADGSRVLIGENFAAFTATEGEFAAAVAHELAHNILQHLAYFEKNGRTQSRVRLSERDADRLAPWLLANAGYDPAEAVRFMTKFGPRLGGWIFRKRTHDGWDERVEIIGEETATIEEARASDPAGMANWSQFFKEFLRPVPPGK